MSEREKREQVPMEFNAEKTQSALRRQDRVEGEQRDKTVSNFLLAAALVQILRDLGFPADKNSIVKFAEQSNRPERNEVILLIERLDDLQYQNVSEVSEAANLVQN